MGEMESYTERKAFDIFLDQQRKIATPLILLIRKYSKKGIMPKVILIPKRKHKRYSLPDLSEYCRFDRIESVNIRYYDGTKTEVY